MKGGRNLGMDHLNGNLICAVSIVATGTNAQESELLSVAFVPINYMLKQWKDYKPFIATLRPKFPENFYEMDFKRNIKNAYKNSAIYGIDPYFAADLFEEWLKQFNFAYGKKVTCLVYDWPYVKSHLVEWLGHAAFSHFILDTARDISVVAQYLNDATNFKNEPAPFTRTGFRDLWRLSNLENPDPTDPFCNAVMTAEVYRLMVSKYKF
jgi:hypothetical protein